ncbi:hypothetical protein SLEP1_g1887 [Rubroshorea leprosula]|uniref:Uncharacterized protein n=1 Tax=Rubroshorea leprosula TaxID=152421 RepID=A0AAV5HP07_9ROSI|nr:hypothetical protein SLEP1_g1887 [Rubroshorea leprosula]
MMLMTMRMIIMYLLRGLKILQSPIYKLDLHITLAGEHFTQSLFCLSLLAIANCKLQIANLGIGIPHSSLGRRRSLLSSQSLSLLSSSPLPHSCLNSALISTDHYESVLPFSSQPLTDSPYCLSVGLSNQSLSFLSSSPLPHSCSNSALISTDLHSDSLRLSTSPSLQPLALAALQRSPLTSS